MIVVDSSVWIDHFRDDATAQVGKLRAITRPRLIFVGDIILLELLQGAQSDNHATLIARELGQFTMGPMLTVELVGRAASNYRRLRSLGVSVRKTIDTIVATFCIEGGHQLLHDDRDFDPFERHLGLQVLRV